MEDLTIHERPTVETPRMILGFTGWMDGGRVSTGTVEYVNQQLQARKFADISPLEFYILNFPISTVPVTLMLDGERTVASYMNPMEFTAIFRPHTRIEEGIIQELTFQDNEFFCSEDASVITFSGAEPHIRWGAFSDCLFRVAQEFGVREIYFVGSVAGPIPHTREPRIRSSVSEEHLRPALLAEGIGFSDYAGPSGLITLMMQLSAQRGLAMSTLVAEVPHYPFLDMSSYPESILRVASALNNLLGLGIDLDDLKGTAAHARDQLDEIMEKNRDFKELVRRLEEAYDDEQSSSNEEVLKQLIDKIDLAGSQQAE